MLNRPTIKLIEDFVAVKPRSIYEIANYLKKNWRTADRYVDSIEQEFGTVKTRIFRKGTRGALKIVYAGSIEKVSHGIFQEELEREIFSGRIKEDFSAFDIFQFVETQKKTLRSFTGHDETALGRLHEFTDLLAKAKKQVLFFSGNLSFVQFCDKKVCVFDTLEKLVKQGVSIKVICRIDFAGLENITKLLSLNKKYGKLSIEIHHRQQPLRATIIDGEVVNLKEIKEPTGRKGELDKKHFIFYTLTDKEWISWLERIFWKMFHSSLGSEKRLEQLRFLA